jgi:hypothetical protein
MKFRRLTKQELQDLEKEFIHFLVSNGIEASDWKKISDTDPEKVEHFVDLFSHIVFKKALKNIKFLEHKSPNSIKYFFCAEDKIVLACIQASEDSNLDFTHQKTMMKLGSGELEAADGEITIYKSEKPYQLSREEEVFKLMEEGGEPCSNEQFDRIYKLAK